MTSITDRVDALFTQWDTTESPGCVLAVIKGGEFIYKRGYGMADLERGVPITAESIFDIGSTGALHQFGIVVGFECDKFRATSWLYLFQKGAKRKPHPWDNNGPHFHASMAADTFFERRNS